MSDAWRCILCGGNRLKAIHQRGPWQYLRCVHCDLVSLFPRPSARYLLEDYQTYLSETPDEINRWEMMMRPIIDRSANLIESASKIPKGRLLDVGCGYGFFLREMKSRGWQVEGVEVSRVGRRYTAENWGIPVHPLPLEDLGLAGSVFDVVTLFYIIEHVHDPLRLLFETKRVLKPGGVVLLRWPHSTPIVRMLGPLSKRFDIYHTPYHLFDFSPKTIAMALIRCGFENPKTIIGGYTHPNNRLGRWASLGFGKIGEALYLLSGGAVLFPGISKTTMAFKAF